MIRQFKSRLVAVGIPICILATGILSFSYLVSVHVLPLFAQEPKFVGQNIPIVTQPEIPYRIEFPTLGITHQIKEAKVIDNNWDIYSDSVSWLHTSATLDTAGNIVLFGHNTQEMLGKMLEIKIGDQIVVSSQNKSFRYQVALIDETEPTDLSFIKSTANVLTIYTCSNFLDSKRFFVIATPLN